MTQVPSTGSLAKQPPRPGVGAIVVFEPRHTDLLGHVNGTVDGGYKALLSTDQQIASEQMVRMHAIVIDASGDALVLSRRSAQLPAALCRARLPLIASGEIEIWHVVREPGVRTKIAITTSVDELLDAPDLMERLCVESILTQIVADSGDPMIDVVPFQNPLSAYACAALAPTEVTHLAIDQDREELRLAMPDGVVATLDRVHLQLAADLVGWSLAVFRDSEHARVRWDAPIVARVVPRAPPPHADIELA